MVQIATALLFALAAGLGITVILGMLRTNSEAILSALVGEGAFPIVAGPQTGPSSKIVPLRRATGRRDAPRPVRIAMPARPPLSRAA
ncbi:hypothetical protein [Sphingopyxis sp. GW247-27LB]|uniref:hypothetical protein n=1 Tax=Sphingopyxis sp. GW247-27LB TaxID=2012632 RepID=UPI000BA6DB3E|nr:hypothetical protein [Sphingopyxis sp. GW247-27LB]PAL24990.1 hypothetical protein CD928_00215 [Sphingopyxis sp. GW247-27LB]